MDVFDNTHKGSSKSFDSCMMYFSLTVEHYTKGKNVELEVCVEDCLPSYVEDVEKLTVLPSTKLRDVIDSALQILKQVDQVIWIGCGPAAGKAVSGAEVIKRRINTLHQLTQLTCKRVEEYWEPKLDGLDTLKVTREIPAVVILLSRLPLDASLPGYQAPGMLGEDFCKPEGRPRRQRKTRTGRESVCEDINENGDESGNSKRSDARTERGRDRRNTRLKSQNFGRGKGRGERTGDGRYDNWRSRNDTKDIEKQGREERFTQEDGNARNTEGGSVSGSGRRMASDGNENNISQRVNNEGYERGKGRRERMTGNDSKNWRNHRGMNNEGWGRGQRGGRGKRGRETWYYEERSRIEETGGEFGRGNRGRSVRANGRIASEKMYEENRDTVYDHRDEE